MLFPPGGLKGNLSLVDLFSRRHIPNGGYATSYMGKIHVHPARCPFFLGTLAFLGLIAHGL